MRRALWSQDGGRAVEYTPSGRPKRRASRAVNYKEPTGDSYRDLEKYLEKILEDSKDKQEERSVSRIPPYRGKGRGCNFMFPVLELIKSIVKKLASGASTGVCLRYSQA